MRVVCVTFGSRGDVMPFTALGRELTRAGVDFCLAAQSMFKADARDTSFQFSSIRGRSVRDLLETHELHDLAGNVCNPLALARQLGHLAELLTPELELIYTDTLAAAAGADVMLCSPATWPAMDVAAYLDMPVIHAHLTPLIMTSAYPAPVAYFPTSSLTPLGNKLSYVADDLLVWQLLRRSVDPARRRVLGLAPRTARQTLAQRRRRRGAVVGISPTVLPVPRDAPADVIGCGYWWPRKGKHETDALGESTERFLSKGAAPLYFSLGSMLVSDPQSITRTVALAARDVGARVILDRGWARLGGGVEPYHDEMHVIDEVPHAALFGRVAAVAHHGGAGTVARGLRYGRPTLVIPVHADQFFWGRRVAALGVGPPPLSLRKLSRQKLAQRFAALLKSTAFANRAAAIGRELANERGEEAAVTAIARLLEAPTAPRAHVTARVRRLTNSDERRTTR